METSGLETPSQVRPVSSRAMLSLGVTQPTEKIDIPESSRNEGMLSTEELDFRWTLPNSIWSHDPPLNDDVRMKPGYLSSNNFETGDFVGRRTKWAIQLNPAYKFGRTRYISLYLWQKRQDINFGVHNLGRGQGVKCIYQFHILGGENELIYERHSGIRTFREGDCVGWPLFLPISSIQKFAAVNNNESTVIRIHLKILNFEDHSHSTSDTAMKNANGIVNKSEKRKLSDTFIHQHIYFTFPGRRFRLKKSILTENSPVLHKLVQSFDSSCQGCSEEVGIVLNDDSDVFNSMIGYFYGKQNALENMSVRMRLSLLKLGLKYEVNSMNTAIFTLLFNETSIENAAEIAALMGTNSAIMDIGRNHQGFHQFKKFFLQNRVAIRETDQFATNYPSLKRFLLKIISN